MKQTHWELEYRHTHHGWVGTGTVYSDLAYAKRALARIHPSKRERYRLSEPKTSTTTGQRFAIKL